MKITLLNENTHEETHFTSWSEFQDYCEDTFEEEIRIQYIELTEASERRDLSQWEWFKDLSIQHTTDILNQFDYQLIVNL